MYLFEGTCKKPQSANWPKITAVDLPLNAVQVGLTVEVSGKKKGVVRKEIEERVLSSFQMVKPKKRGNEYELTVGVEDGNALSAITDQIRWDMELLAELDDCEVEVTMKFLGEEKTVVATQINVVPTTLPDQQIP